MSLRRLLGSRPKSPNGASAAPRLRLWPAIGFGCQLQRPENICGSLEIGIATVAAGSRLPQLFNGRGGQIRTDDLYVPNVALYQAKLRPDIGHLRSSGTEMHGRIPTATQGENRAATRRRCNFLRMGERARCGVPSPVGG